MTKSVLVYKNIYVPHTPYSIEKALPTDVEKAFLVPCCNLRTTEGATRSAIDCLLISLFQSTHLESCDSKRTFLPVTFVCTYGALFHRHHYSSQMKDSIKIFLPSSHVFLALLSYPLVDKYPIPKITAIFTADFSIFGSINPNPNPIIRLTFIFFISFTFLWLTPYPLKIECYPKDI